MFLIMAAPLQAGSTDGASAFCNCFSCFLYLARRFWNHTWRSTHSSTSRFRHFVLLVGFGFPSIPTGGREGGRDRPSTTNQSDSILRLAEPVNRNRVLDAVDRWRSQHTASMFPNFSLQLGLSTHFSYFSRKYSMNFVEASVKIDSLH